MYYIIDLYLASSPGSNAGAGGKLIRAWLIVLTSGACPSGKCVVCGNELKKIITYPGNGQQI